MKLCTFQVKDGDAGPRAGILRDGSVYDVDAIVPVLAARIGKAPMADYSSVIGILRGGRPVMDVVTKMDKSIAEETDSSPAARYKVGLDKVQLLAPVPRPNSIRDFMVFEEHLVNSMHTVVKNKFPPLAWLSRLVQKGIGKPLLRPPNVWYRIPAYYKGNPDSVIGPGRDIEWPSYTEKLDYELEFGVYIMGAGKDVKKEDAESYIAGYTIFNDVSARDFQMREMGARLGPAKGKDFDTGNVMGPWLVTPDEVGDPYSLKMEALVNGEVWSSGTSAGMRFKFPDIIEHVSMSETLRPGDFLGSGTMGTGCGLELDRWIRPGDSITLKVEKLGELTNKVVRRKK